jgi:hypothetical protein
VRSQPLDPPTSSARRMCTFETSALLET